MLSVNGMLHIIIISYLDNKMKTKNPTLLKQFQRPIEISYNDKIDNTQILIAHFLDWVQALQ